MSYKTDRHRDKRKRRRRDYYDDDDDEGGISGWKLGLVIGVVVVCFAMLYPTLFHPMIMGLLGRGQQPKPSINQQRPPIHPAMGGAGGMPGARPTRPDMHPAMRMAQAQAESTASGGGKGMFTWLLPVYTVGVIAFLLYTLFKSKTKKRRRRRDYFDSEEDEDDSDMDSECDTKYGGKFGKRKLQGLQERLRQTEEAMSKILEQLESVQAGANPIDLDAAVKAEQEKGNHEKQEKQEFGLNEKNEQYINDLEVAIKEFQALSKEYDKAKIKKLKKQIESSEDDSELDSELSEEELELTEKIPRVSKKSGKNTSEEDDEKERMREQNEAKAEDEEEEEEGFDVDKQIELDEKLKKEENNDNKARRRRRKAKKI